MENSCHRVIDAIYRENHNQARNRNAAANQSIMRRPALAQKLVAALGNFA